MCARSPSYLLVLSLLLSSCLLEIIFSIAVVHSSCHFNLPPGGCEMILMVDGLYFSEF